ncbi:hypothetical protein BDR04DRAFT_1003400 [Suillus decipiens]|nr:hypothetical protein BDR04DRAFT_1003400 [Suillus decipiens]
MAYDEQLQNLNSIVAKLVSEVATLSESNQQILLINAQQSVTNDALTSQVKILADQVQTLQTDISELQATTKSQKKLSGKNISNDHPALKQLIPPMFCNLCGIDTTLNRNQRPEALGAIQPLESGAFFETIDESVDAKFIKEVADCVYNDEKHCCESLHAKGEIPDKDFNIQVIMQCTKDYFHNIHKQVLSRSDADKARKAQEKKDQIRQWTHCQTVSSIFAIESNVTYSVAMIDTDFASDILSYDEGDLSDDKLEWRAKSGAGKGANMTVGLQWQSPHTPHDSRKVPLDANTATPTEGMTSTTDPTTKEHPRKCRRTTAGQNKKLIKKTFDINPDQMNDNPPKSARKNTPFEHMVANHWKKTHPDMAMLQGVEWLVGFWDRAQKNKFIAEDWDYLVELEKWHKKQEEGLDMSEDESAAGSP